MKITLLVLFISFSYQLVNAQKIHKATVISAPLSTTSTFTISCESFESNFKELKRVIEITSDNYRQLEKLLNKSIFKQRDSIDVRGQLLLELENKKIKKICFDEFDVFYDGAKYFENSSLLEYLLKYKLIEE